MSEHYDVVIVGAGISGAIMAAELGKNGKKVLILEAGTGTKERFFNQTELHKDKQVERKGYHSYLDNYYNATVKIPNAPYPNNPNAPSPQVSDIAPIRDNKPLTNGYFVQKGPLPFASSYTRTEGGTTLHWLGTCLRMLPEDFKLKSTFGRGLDWPISYDDLQPWYEMAEHGIGVSGNADEQNYHQINNMSVQIPFCPDYNYPMEKIPQSYLDDTITKGVSGMTVSLDEGGYPTNTKQYPVDVVSTPQARNGMPRGQYRPVGAVGDPDVGQRCAGNASCVPICPIQAKYSALKTLEQARKTGNVEVRNKSVVYDLDVDPVSQKISKVHYKAYKNPQSPQHECKSVSGDIVVLASHAVENAKILLACWCRQC